MDILVVDFNDSFTHNIVSLLNEWNISCEIISFENINLDYIEELRIKNILWGPGPGHPEEYKKVSTIISELFEKNEVFQIGICLGHQILMKELGFRISDAPIKLHGRKGKFLVPAWSFFEKSLHGKELLVQYYNSLGVYADNRNLRGMEFVIENGVINSSMGPKHLSFQFHPESVGTSCPEAFIYGLRNSLI